MNNYNVVFKDGREQYIVYNVDDLKELPDSYEFFSNGICIAIIPKDIVYTITATGMEDGSKDKKVDLEIYFKGEKGIDTFNSVVFTSTTDIETEDGMYNIYDENGIMAMIAKDSVLCIKRLTNN